MTTRTSVSISVLALLLLAVVAHAGAPLKGVDVKLGKEPGGGASARTTNVDGKIDLGILPAGSYYLIVSAPKGAEDTDALIEIHGAKGGTIKKRWNYAQKKAFDAATDAAARAAGEEKIVFNSDGSHPVDIVATAVVKAESNISNN